MTPLLTQLIAQTIENRALNTYSDISATEFLGGLIPALVGLGLVIGAIVFLFYFIMGAISWITSSGDKMKLELARKRIVTALVGLFILLSFIGIISLLETFFGIGMRRIEVGPFRIELTGDDAPYSPPEGCGEIGEAPPCCDPSNRVCEDDDGYHFCWYDDTSCPPNAPI